MVDSDIHAELAPTPDASILGNFTYMPPIAPIEDPYPDPTVHSSNPPYTGGTTSALQNVLVIAYAKQLRNLATDNRGYLYVPNGDEDTSVTIYSPGLGLPAGKFGEFIRNQGRGIDVIRVNGDYFAYFSTLPGMVERWNVTNVVTPTLDATWGTTVNDSAANGTINLSTKPVWSGIELIDLAVDSDGTVYLTGKVGTNHHVIRITGDGDLHTATSTIVANANYLVIVGDKLYVTTGAGADSEIIVLDKQTLADVATWEPTLTFPTAGDYAGIDVGLDGRLYVVDQNYRTSNPYTPPATSFNPSPAPIEDEVNFDRILVSSPIATPTHITSDVIGSGTIEMVYDKDFYFVGDVVTVQAMPAPGSTFTGWSGTLDGDTVSKTFMLGASVHFTATFVPKQYTVSINVQGNGSVALDPNQASYAHNSQVTASAMAAPGWQFAGWSGESASQSPILPFTIDHNTSLTATFTPIPYTLAVGVLGSGSVTLLPAKATYSYADNVTATATPADGWTFSHWSGDLAGSTNPHALAINANQAITAHFAPKQYTISATASAPLAGTVTGSGLYNHGDTATISALPTAGFIFDTWLENGAPLSTSNPLSFVAASHRTLVASFKPLQSATLHLNKVIVGSSAYAPPEGWHIDVAATTYTLPPAGGTQIIGSLAPGTYTIREHDNTNYAPSVTCGDQSAAAATIQIDLLPAQTLECTFTNTLRNATLTVNRVVINDNGGSATAADFPLLVDGTPLSQGVAVPLTPGTHTVSEISQSNYATTYSGSCSATGIVTLLPGQSATCTITNDDLPPDAIHQPIKLEKSVGLVDGTCASTTTLAVVAGEVVYYCYTLTNQSNLTFTAHTLIDSQLGAILGNLPVSLAPGQSISTVDLGITASQQIESAAVTTATWSVSAASDGSTAQASATTTVTVGTQELHLTGDATYTPPANSKSTGGQISYQLNVHNAGTAMLKEVQLTVLLPDSTSLRSNLAGWQCISAPQASILCTRTIALLAPGEVASHSLDLDLTTETTADQLVLTVTAKTHATSSTPSLSRSVTLHGPDATARVTLFLPGLRHH